MKRCTFEIGKRLVMALAAICATGSLPLEAAVKKPVADAANPLFLKGMANSPWWNADWKKRLPIVVAETSTNKVANFFVDVVLDFGEKVDPKDVRVVTGYGEEIPCWAGVEKAEADGRPDALRLQFRTDLRVLENKPFFVYYDNPKAAAVETPRTVFVTETEELIALDNGRLHLEFSKDSRFRSPFHVFKIVGSESANEFATTTGGTAHYGLTPCLKGDRDGQTYEFEPTKVSARQVSPWKAVVTAESASVRMTYILSADSDRVDYVYEPLDGKRISGIYTSWLSGGGIAWDDFVYPSLTGELRTMRAALDMRDDCGDGPSYPRFGESCSEGWFLIRDRYHHTAIGQFYNPGDFESLSHAPNDFRFPSEMMRLEAKVDGKTPAAALRGAAFGTYRDNGSVRAAYYEWAYPPKVLVGKAEPFRAIAERKPDMAHDFCAFFQIRVDDTLISPKNDVRFIDFEADAVAKAVKRLGMNGVMQEGVCVWETLGLDRETFDYLAGLTNHPNFTAWKATCDFEESQERFVRAQRFVKDLHDRNLGVYYWGCFMAHNRLWAKNSERVKGYGKFREVDLKVARQLAKIGFDAVWCGIIGNEGPDWCPDETKRFTNSYWLWPEKERGEYLDYLDSYVDHVRDFRKAVKEANPNAHVLAWGCDNGNLPCVERHLESADCLDVAIDEIMVGESRNHGKNKTSSAQMRAMFDNEPHTVWNHFWERRATDDVRIGDCDQAFAFGVNGFNQEADNYAYVDRDNPANMSDFYHFVRYTGLADVSPKLVPVKYAVVYRDSDEVREDIMIGNRTGHTWTDPWPTMAFAEVVAHNWTGARGFQCDRVINQHFNLKGLRRYRILALAHNAHLPKDKFEIAKEFVRGGGVCYVEGEDFPFLREIQALPADAALTRGTAFFGYTLGKGSFIYAPGHASREKDAPNLRPGSELRELLAKAAKTSEPLVFAHADVQKLNGQLRSDGTRAIFSAYADDDFNGGKPGWVKVKLDWGGRREGAGLFALDVKRATRAPFSGELEYFQAPGECAFILIGDEQLTAIPEAKVIAASDAGNRTPVGLLTGAAKSLAERAELGDFKAPIRVIIFADGDKDGKAEPNFRFTECEVAQDVVTPKTFNKVKFIDYLEKAKALVFLHADRTGSNVAFAECGAELKDFLKRGGTILFHCSSTPDAARKLFAEIGVFDPDANGCRVKVRDGWASSDEGKGKTHLLYKSVQPIDKPWGRGHLLQYAHALTKWDAAKQQAFYLSKPEWRLDGKDTAMVVTQEKVLGLGKVVFEENDRAFTRWYENLIYGENLISYIIDMNVGEHIRKVNILNGGPGEVTR